MEKLKHVLSHPQALDQCEMTLSSLGVVSISAPDTTGAACTVITAGVGDKGANVSARAAGIYGLIILQEKMQDESESITRYMILGREPIIPGTNSTYKTSIFFNLEEGPRVLFKALTVFVIRDINLTKVKVAFCGSNNNLDPGDDSRTSRFQMEENDVILKRKKKAPPWESLKKRR